MRTIKNLPVPKEQDLVKFPNSTILNETDTTEGTPVVREIYGDIITNIYAFLVERGIIPNEIEDNEVNGYQFLNALKLNVNKLNDVRQVLEVSGVDTFYLDIDFSLLSDNYPLFVKSPEKILINKNIITAEKKIFYLEDKNGIKKVIYFNKSVNIGDELLFIISNEITAVNLIHEDLYDDKVELNIQGVPLSYSTSDLNDYLSNNILIYNDGSYVDLYDFIESNLVIKDVVLIDENYIILCIDSIDEKLKLYKFKRGESIVNEILIQGINDNNQDPGINNLKVQIYAYKNKIALSHKGGNSLNPYRISMYDYDGSNLLKFNSDIVLDITFSASSNYLMSDDNIIINNFEGQELIKYTFSGQKESVYRLKQNLVNLYTKNVEDRYIQVDETAVKWK